MPYRYRITVEAVPHPEDKAGVETALASPAVQFEAVNHDDLIAIIQTVRAKRLLETDKAASLALGLKLFSEVVLEQRQDPMFAPVLGPIREFIQRLKSYDSSGKR